jgi:pSer/pThr/pTyr-binding forkhead associated (FHA) protein
MTRLIMRRGPYPGKVYDLNADIVTIGSGSKNNIVILDNDISREHSRLIRVMADYELYDLNSPRGTFVSGQRVKAGWLLKPGDLIELGENVTFEYERAGAAAEMENVPSIPQPVHTEKPDPSAHPSLVMVVGPKAGQVFPLKTEKVKVGRDVTNDIVIQDPEVSRFHACLRWADTSYELEDLGSTNGTMINGAPLAASTPKLLHTNDLVHFAELAEFRYTWQPDDIQIDRAPKPIKVSSKLATRELTHLDTNEAKLFVPKTQRQTSKLGTGLQPGVLEDHIFVTYAREEWETIVAPLTAIVQDAGHKVWVDQYLSQGGDDWMVAVEQALSECWLLIVVVSPESLNSRYVRLAYRYFFNREKPVIPLLYANVEELPLELKKFKLVRYDTHNRKGTFDDVISEIQQRRKSQP